MAGSSARDDCVIASGRAGGPVPAEQGKRFGPSA
jgi:hypothetical protein